MDDLQVIIDQAWNNKDSINFANKNADSYQQLNNAVNQILDLLDKGALRVCQKVDDQWIVHQWIKKAILLSFRLHSNKVYSGGPADENGSYKWFDKVPLKTNQWDHAAFEHGGFRSVPGSIIRRSAYIAPNTVLMPCFVNVGAFVDSGTMIDTWSTVGSCAQIGKDCHISGGVGIGGVLEPLQANPVIIEDNCFIGARSEIAEGVIIEQGAVISMGVFIGSSTKIVNRVTGDVSYGRVPAYSVVVPGTIASGASNIALNCAVIVKQVDAKTRSKTSINDLLRN